MARPSVRRFALVGLLLPSVSSTLGIDGGQIFQILAIQTLGLSPGVIGFAFGLGVVSIPVQIASTRFGLHRAGRNLRLFVSLAAVQVAVLAVLTFRGRSDAAAAALGVTVLAEITLSVLFATSWQPLLAVSLSSRDRQFMNSKVSAAATIVLAGAVLAFDSLNKTGRGIFLVGVTVMTAALAASLCGVQSPVAAPPAALRNSAPLPRLSGELRWLFGAIACVNVGAMPLFLIYVRKVLWPTANLGIVGAVQLTGSLLASFLWRSSGRPPTRRARISVTVLAASALALAAIRAPVSGSASEAGVLALTAVTGAALTTTRLSIIELVHRAVVETIAVRSFTLLDVIASSSLQAGLAIAGLAVSASASRANWPVDPYRIALIATTVLATAVTLTRVGGHPRRQPVR
jgi:hypothetical protein